MSALAVLRIPGTPPSLNAVGYRSHWAVGRRYKQQWQEWIEGALMLWQLPPMHRVDATATIYFGHRRRRDEGNFRVILEKALGDALVNGPWLPDDTPDHYQFGRVTLLAPYTEPMTEITLDYQEVRR